MKHLSSYPKVYNLGHSAIQELLLGPVLAEEKIDGSQFTFGLITGERMFRSKKAEVRPGAAGMFTEGVEAVKDLDLHPEWVYRAEYLRKPKHNTLAYNRVPKCHCIIFDIQTGLETYLTHKEKMREAWRVGLEVVPWLGFGRLRLKDFEKMLEEQSCLGGQTVEGVVLKNYKRFTRDGKAMMGKHVSEKFKETHRKSWKDRNPGGHDVIERLVQYLRSEARWHKAVQHLREQEMMTDSPKDIGPLIGEVKRDVLEEEAEHIMKELYGWAKQKVAQGVARGLPEWYKKILMDKQFEVTDE